MKEGVADPGREMANLGDVGVNANYLSHPSNSVISSGLAIRFTDAVVISKNRATDAPVYPNFRIFSLGLAWPQFIPFLTPVKFYVFFISLCTNVPSYFMTLF